MGFVMREFKDVDAAFSAFDVAGNGQLNLAEFLEGAKRINFTGDAEAVFKFFDNEDTRTIGRKDLIKLRELPAAVPRASTAPASTGRSHLSMTNFACTPKDATLARKLRSPIKDPLAHRCGITLNSTDVGRPLGKKMRSASCFYTFNRTATGRMDGLLHPDQHPGENPDPFSPEHGPGYLQRGPEYFPEIGCFQHPRRGDKWKAGATINREPKLGPLIPSTEARFDRDLAGMSFATHEGRRPSDSNPVTGGHKICNTGGISWSKSPVRPGITHR